MRIPFDMGFVFHPGASDEDNALALKILLEALIALDRVYLTRFPRTAPLYKSGVVYGRTRVWDTTCDLYARRYGDCKSLTAARIAELRQHGEKAQPEFRFAINTQENRKDFHILVLWSNGREDPSRRLGMDEYHSSRGLWVFPE